MAFVHIDHVSEASCQARFLVVIQTVPGNVFLFIRDGGASKEFGVVGFVVEIAILRGHHATFLHNFAWSNDMCQRGFRVIMQLIGGDNALAVVHFHIIPKGGFARLGVVIAPIRY